MTQMNDYLEKKLLDHTLGITAFTKPTAAYVSLLTASPTDTGSHAAEVTAGGYARQSITASMNATTATTGLSNNASAITHGPATADWGTVTHVGIEDDPTISGGNMMMWGAATSSRTIQTGDSYQLAAGQLAITFQ